MTDLLSDRMSSREMMELDRLHVKPGSPSYLRERRENRLFITQLTLLTIWGVPAIFIAWHQPMFVALVGGGTFLGMMAFKYWLENLRNPFQ